MGVSDSTIVAYSDKGLLKHRLLPSGHRRFQRSDIEALLAPAPSSEGTG